MRAQSDRVYAVILAAGASSRMGRPKQLLVWQERPLLEHAIINAQAVLPGRVLVVLGANAETIGAGVNLHGSTAIINPHWAEGMAASIRAGVRALPAGAAGVLLLLCDQPLIAVQHLELLLKAWQARPDCIAAGAYKQTVGAPALFPAPLFPELLKLSGDRGAKALFMRYPEKVLKIPLPEAEIDFDCWGDYEGFRG